MWSFNSSSVTRRLSTNKDLDSDLANGSASAASGTSDCGREHKWWVLLQAIGTVSPMMCTVVLRLEVEDHAVQDSTAMNPRGAQTTINESFMFVLDPVEEQKRQLRIEMCMASDVEEVMASASLAFKNELTSRWIELLDEDDGAVVARLQLSMVLNPSTDKKHQLQQRSEIRPPPRLSARRFSNGGDSGVQPSDDSEATQLPRNKLKSRRFGRSPSPMRRRSKSRDRQASSELTDRVNSLTEELRIKQQQLDDAEARYEAVLSLSENGKDELAEREVALAEALKQAQEQLAEARDTLALTEQSHTCSLQQLQSVVDETFLMLDDEGFAAADPEQSRRGRAVEGAESERLAADLKTMLSRVRKDRNERSAQLEETSRALKEAWQCHDQNSLELQLELESLRESQRRSKAEAETLREQLEAAQQARVAAEGNSRHQTDSLTQHQESMENEIAMLEECLAGRERELEEAKLRSHHAELSFVERTRQLNETIASKTRQIGVTEQRVTALMSEFEALQHSKDAMEADLNLQIENLKQANSETISLTLGSGNSLTKELESKQRQIKAMEAQARAVAAERAALVRQHALAEEEFQQQLASAHKEVDVLRTELVKQERQVDLLTAAREELTRNHNSELTQQGEKLKMLTDADSEKRQRIDSLTVRITALQRALDAKESAAKEQEASLRSVTDRHDETKTQMNELREKLNNTLNEVSRLQRARQEDANEALVLQSAIAKNQEKVKTQSRELARLRESATVLAHKDLALKSAQGELGRLKNAHKQVITEHQRHKSSHDKQVEHLNGQLKRQVTEAARLKQQLLGTQQEHKRMVPVAEVKQLRRNYVRSGMAGAAFAVFMVVVALLSDWRGADPLVAQCEAAVGDSYVKAIDSIKAEHSRLVLGLYEEREQLRGSLDHCTSSSASQSGDRKVISALQAETKRLQLLVENHTLSKINTDAQLYELRAEHEEKSLMLEIAQGQIEAITAQRKERTQFRLEAGENLHPHELLLSCEGRPAGCIPHFLRVGADGDVVILRGSKPTGDGNQPMWSTKTGKKPRKNRFGQLVPPHHEFRLRRDGVLVVVDTDRAKVLWQSTGLISRKREIGNYVATIDNAGRLVVSLNGVETWASPMPVITASEL